MNTHSPEADCYRAFIQNETPNLDEMFDDDAIESDVIYQYACLKLHIHFASRFDTDEIRNILAQDPDVKDNCHTLVTQFFADAAYDLQTMLIENSPAPSGRQIGRIIGIETPQPSLLEEVKPATFSVANRIALYNALPLAEKAAHDRAVAGIMKLSP